MVKAYEIPAIRHSWTLMGWPTDVYANDANRARYIVRVHRAELLAAGALSRIGRQIVVLGLPYTSWLARHASRVEGFSPAINDTARREAQGEAA